MAVLQARLTPCRPACICGAVRLSYGGFARAAHAVAARIVASAAAAGVPHVRGRRLVLLLPKAEVLPVTYMACNMLRCPVSTLDTRNPPAMLAYQVGLWDPALLVCRRKAHVRACGGGIDAELPLVEIGDIEAAWAEGGGDALPGELIPDVHACEVAAAWLVPPAGAAGVVVSNAAAAAAAAAAADAAPGIAASGTAAKEAATADAGTPALAWELDARMDDIAFIEWTSGTTGKPKGAEVSHRGMVHWIFWRWWQFPLVPRTHAANDNGGGSAIAVAGAGSPFAGGAVDEFITALNLFFVWYGRSLLTWAFSLFYLPQLVSLSPLYLLLSTPGTGTSPCRWAAR